MTCNADNILSWSRNRVALCTSRLSSVGVALFYRIKLWTLSFLLPFSCFLSCSSLPPSVQFSQPSTLPIQKAHTVIHEQNSIITTQHKEAQKQLTTTAQDLDKILDACPQAKVIIAEAQFSVAKAQEAVAAAETARDISDNARAQAEGAREQLDHQLKDQTDNANAVARDYESSKVQINSLKEARHSWVKRFWIAAGIATLAGLWIFKKPLLLMIGL